MANITDWYGISRAVPFLDVDVHQDSAMFIDPHAVRLSSGPQPHAEDAQRALVSFFHQVSTYVLAGDPTTHRQGLVLLQSFTEPWETRLGLSRSGIFGHGGSSVVGEWIWRALNDDLRALLEVGILTRVEELPLFVEGVDRDITSDLTTRIIFRVLAAFTREMVGEFPEFTAGRHQVTTVTRRVWDTTKHAWTDAVLELPVAAERPLLLVPRDWARPRLLMSARRYFDTSILSFVQDEGASFDRVTGRLSKTPKDRLRLRPDLPCSRSTNLDVTLRASHGDRANLLRLFRDFVRARYEPLSDGEIAARLGR